MDFAQREGGLLDLADLAGFETHVEEPVTVNYRGYDVYKCGPWSQGPVFLQQLRLLEGFHLRALGHNSSDYIHLVTEASKLAFADREAYYGDPRFIDVPVQELLSPTYAELRRSLIDPDRASLTLRPGDPLGGQALRADVAPLVGREWQRGTVHVDVVGTQRNMVSATPSGAWIADSPVVEGVGFPLGTRIQMFYLDAAHPNCLAARQAAAYDSHSVPRSARRQTVYGLRHHGSRSARSKWTLQFFLNVVEFDMPVQAAIEAPKFSSKHFPSSTYPHTAEPGVLRIEGRVPYEVRRTLQAKGHEVVLQPDWVEGYVVGIQVDTVRGSCLLERIHAASRLRFCPPMRLAGSFPMPAAPCQRLERA